MATKTLTAAILLLLLMGNSGCYYQSIYTNTYTPTQTSYHAMPMLADSNHHANYATVSANFALANADQQDRVFMMQAKWHQGRKLGPNFLGYFGAQVNAGYYDVNPVFGGYDSLQNETYAKINEKAGINFSGSVGINAGAAFTVPLGTRHEWRIIGLEFALAREFGSYLNFRKGLPENLELQVDKNSWPLSLGGYTEFVFRPSNPKVRLGFLLGIGSGVVPIETNTFYYEKIRPRYFYQTFQFTYDRYTSFFSGRLGNYYGGFQCGLSMRL